MLTEVLEGLWIYQGLTAKEIFREDSASLQDRLDKVDVVLDFLSEMVGDALVFVVGDSFEDSSVGALGVRRCEAIT